MTSYKKGEIVVLWDNPMNGPKKVRDVIIEATTSYYNWTWGGWRNVREINLAANFESHYPLSSSSLENALEYEQLSDIDRRKLLEVI